MSQIIKLILRNYLIFDPCHTDQALKPPRNFSVWTGKSQ